MLTLFPRVVSRDTGEEQVGVCVWEHGRRMHIPPCNRAQSFSRTGVLAAPGQPQPHGAWTRHLVSAHLSRALCPGQAFRFTQGRISCSQGSCPQLLSVAGRGLHRAQWGDKAEQDLHVTGPPGKKGQTWGSLGVMAALAKVAPLPPQMGVGFVKPDGGWEFPF